MTRVPLPSETTAGFARTLAGEEIEYHAPIPGANRGLVVRSEDAARGIEWESAPVPDAARDGDVVTFALLAALDANEDRRRFELSVDGRPVLAFHNPATARSGTVAWEGEAGVRAEFRITLVDRYADEMGFLFLHLPVGMVRPGEPVRLGVRGESAGTRTWFMVFAHPLEPGIEVHPVPAVVRSSNGPLQELRVDLVRLDEGGPVVLRSPAGVREVESGFGHTRLSLTVPPVDRRTEVPIAFDLDGGRYEARVGVEPVRPLTIHLIHHTHLDIGYTHVQDEVERMQWEHLEQALQLGAASESFPPAARFVWHPEAVWAVETYLEHHSEEENERLLEGIRRGWIHLDALHTNLLTGIATGEGLIREIEPAQRLAERAGVPLRSAMFTDIPGFAWGMVATLAEAGVRYLSVGPNRWHRIGSFLSTWGDRPFWWESPNGEHRILVWVHAEGYSLFHTGLGYEQLDRRLDADLVLGAVESLGERGWNHPIAALRYNIGSDNGPPDPTLSDTVRAWNERYESPKLAIASSESALAELEALCGDSLPVVRGDLNGIWEDGVASSARETQSIRHTAEWLMAAEVLAAMDGRALEPARVYAAWRQLLLSYEHTWGAWNSIGEPEADFVQRQWEEKKRFVREAARLTNELVAATLGERIEGEPDPEEQTGSIEIVNPLAWPRAEVVVLDRIAARDAVLVKTQEGESLPFQRLADGGIAFRTPSVAGFSSERVSVVRERRAAPRPDESDRLGRVHADAGSRILLDNGVLQLGLDPLTGRIVSLRRVDGSGPSRDLVPEGEALAEWLYVRGRDPGLAEPAGGGRVEVTDLGPLIWRAVVRREAPGTRGGIEATLRLVAGSDRVEIEVRFDKERSLEPEAVLLRFPLALTAESTERVVGGARAPFRAGTDQAPGANRNWYTVERWADLHDAAGGLTLVTVDAPLVQLGSIGSDPIVTGWRDTVDPAPVLYSYLMNNYWETNYRAEQEGPHAIRYVLRAHGGFEVTGAERFGLEAAHPLLVYRVRPGLRPLLPPVEVTCERAVVTLLRRTSTTLEVRAFNPSHTRDLVYLRIPGSNSETRAPLDPGQVATLRLPLPPSLPFDA